MATIFSEIEKKAFDNATKLTRTQAFIVGISEDEDKKGMYQCQVLPDLLLLEDVADCPWYPLLDDRKKLALQEGDLVWMYVTKDLGVGFVWGKANSIADQPEEQEALWENLQESLSELDSESDFETPVDIGMDYETSFYWEVYPGRYIFFDKEQNFVGIISTEEKAAILFKDNKIHVRIPELHLYTDMFIKGKEHYSKGDWEIIGEEHYIEGAIEHKGDVKHEGDTEQSGDFDVEGDQSISGSLTVAGGGSPAARADETIDIIDQIEEHIHATPSGPAGPPLTPTQAPLSAQLVALKQALPSTTTDID